MSEERPVRCMIMRGGTSKGAYFDAADLPQDPAGRDDLLRRILGSPDPRQIDGIGGAHPLTSKVAIVGPAADDDADVEYRFLQVGIDDDLVTDQQNCGNLLAGVGPFAVERSLVPVVETGPAELRIRMLNTGTLATARFAMRDGRPVYDGDTTISGVPGRAAPIQLDFENLAGSSTGALLPTGQPLDVVEGIPCTLIDSGMPVVVIRAADLGLEGDEPCQSLEADVELRATIETVRLTAGRLMGLGDVTDATMPKVTIVSPAQAGGDFCTRTFIPHRCHDAIGVLGAVSVAAAALVPDSIANDLVNDGGQETIRIEHPTGFFDAVVSLQATADGGFDVRRAGIVRTARKIMDGEVFPRPAGT